MLASSSRPHSTSGPSSARELDDAGADELLATTAAELVLFRALTRVRPIGLHKHFAVLTLRSAIAREAGALVPPAAIWRKLEQCYDIRTIDYHEPDGFPVGDAQPPSAAVDRPTWPTEPINLAAYPYFVAEFNLPADPFIDGIIATRRASSRASSPAASVAELQPSLVPESREKSFSRATRGSKRKRAQLSLVEDESESSALTESGEDASPTGTPADSDRENDHEEEHEDKDDGESSRSHSPSTKKKGTGRGGGPGKGWRKGQSSMQPENRGGSGRGGGRARGAKRRKQS